MSGHADTIRAESIKRVLRGQWADEEARQKALVATDALLAENQRYEKALEYYAGGSWGDHGELAREALAGDTE